LQCRIKQAAAESPLGLWELAGDFELTKQTCLAAVGVGVLVKGGVEAGTGLSGGRKPGTGRDCFPFTLRVVKREISTAKPTRLVMITITVSRAPRASRFVGGFEWIEPQAANSVAVVPTRAASIPITVLK
jgi:hypothetical protein